jgi:peptidoglycan/LPS O-acetylase OafA/YrhL
MTDPPEKERLRFDHFRLGFRPALDGLRGIAMIIVLIVHGTYLWDPFHAGLFLPGGYIAVDVFFALSGFLITSLLLREFGRTDKISFRGFYRRRALRLLPVLYALLIAQFFYTLYYGQMLWENLKGLFSIFFYYSNWAIVFHLPQAFGTQQTWSLGVEEQFYILWPLALWGIAKIPSRRVAIGVFVSLMVFALAFRELLWHLNVPYYKIYVQSEVRLDVLMAGSLMAYLLATGWKPNEQWGKLVGWAGVVGLALVTAFVPVDSRYLYHYGGFTIIALAAGATVYLAMVGNNLFSRFLSWKVMEGIGFRSYSLYLWHYLIFLAVVRALPTASGYARVALGFAITIVVSELSHQLLEKPFLRLKNRSTDPTALTPTEAQALKET